MVGRVTPGARWPAPLPAKAAAAQKKLEDSFVRLDPHKGPPPPKAIDPRAPTAGGEVMIASYNVENLYDAEKDPTREWNDFTPGGAYAWTEERATRKLANVGKVIRAMNAGQGPDIVALSEVENAGILGRLRDEALADLGYQSAVHLETADWRGIDNAILSKHPLIGEPQLHEVHRPGDPLWGKDTTRGILEATFDVHGVPLTVLVCHLPRGLGSKKRAAQRADVARQVRELVAKREAESPGREIVVLGDFNGNPGDGDVAPALAASASADAVRTKKAAVLNTVACLADQIAFERSKKRVSRLEQVEDVLALHGKHLGTVLDRDKDEPKWLALDHILVSRGLLDGEGLSWVPGSTQVLREPWMVDEESGPKPFYERGVKLADQKLVRSGYSDHLPVVARLKVNGGAGV